MTDLLQIHLVQIQWTAPDREEAFRIAGALVNKKWVACANIIPNVESIFFWEGEVQTSMEVKVYLKTIRENFPKIRDYIQENCSYDVPEITAVGLEKSNEGYHNWVVQTVQ